MIHRVRIQNFKSILDVSVDLSPVTVLVGRSGTGKSNFVESLRFLRDLLVGRVDLLQRDWEHVRPAANKSGSTGFQVEFSVSGVEDRYKYTLTLGNDGPQSHPSNECLELGSKTIFHQGLSERQNLKLPNRQFPIQWQWIAPPELMQPPNAGPVALGRIPSISDTVIAFTALSSGIGCYSFSDQVLCDSKNSTPSTGLEDDARNYVFVLKDIVSNLQDLHIRKSIVNALQRINPAISSVELNDLRQPNDVVVGHMLYGKTLNLKLSQESDGFRRFYAHLLALYQRPPKQTMIFEHPEDGIHPGALSLLAEEFKASPADGRGQVILTTHSRELLDQFDADEIRVVELQDFETRIGLMSSEQREAINEQLLTPGELLTVDPARIESPAPEAAGA